MPSLRHFWALAKVYEAWALKWLVCRRWKFMEFNDTAPKSDSSSECSGWAKKARGLKRTAGSREGWTMRYSHIQKISGQTFASSTTDGLQLNMRSCKNLSPSLTEWGTKHKWKEEQEWKKYSRKFSSSIRPRKNNHKINAFFIKQIGDIIFTYAARTGHRGRLNSGRGEVY